MSSKRHWGVPFVVGLAACSYDYDAFQSGSLTTGGGPSGGAGNPTGSGAGATGASGVGGSPAGGGGSNGGGSAGSGTAGRGVGGVGGGEPGKAEYVATIARCTSYENPDYDNCEAQVDPGNMLVDTNEGNTGEPMGVFLRFELDGAFAGRTVTAVRLSVRVTDYSLGASADTGEVFEAAPFVLSDLDSVAPAQVGGVLGANQGPVAMLEIVEWPLPTSLVAPSSSVFLTISPVSTDLVAYYNDTMPDAPILSVSFE